MTQALPFEHAFRAFARSPSSAVEGALLISRVVLPDTDAGWCRAELRRLANTAGASVAALLTTLRDAGFRGAEEYYAPENSALEFVLRERRGIPITLAMVAIGTAERCGLPATGVNFPGHFLVDLDGTLVDPFVMMPLDEATRADWLARAGRSADEAFRPAGPIDVVLRMLNNLKGLAVGDGDFARALDFTAYQLIVSPEPFTLHLERAELWRAFGSPAMARREIETAIAVAPDPEIRSRLERRLERFAGDAPTLH